ncbi:related to nitrogen assimilation transcription factor [Ceraceosorus bombacis]|uniref:Related to nitrogen assimilation transcription factor n=1 Tax=Ceraceosorus bombacis TaxID=401625 RepID=A0A0P1BI43_9BASI|nr:related to nitrogen assimilation transcription factor [Ceraceosorus bombacis]
MVKTDTLPLARGRASRMQSLCGTRYCMFLQLFWLEARSSQGVQIIAQGIGSPIELERISAERGIQLPNQTSGPEGPSMPTPTAAPQDGLGQRSTSSEERDSEFLGINEKGEVSHRGSSSGIHLLHRQSQQQAPGKSPLKPHSAQPLTTLEGLADRGIESSAEGAKRSGKPVSIVPLPLARPSGNRQNSGADSSKAPLRGFPLRGVPVLSNGAQANRDHILNTLSPSGVPSRRLFRGNVDSNGSSTSASSSPRPEGRTDNADASEATALRACLVNIRDQTTLMTEQSQDLMENVDDELELWDDQVEMHSEESVGKPTAARPRYIHAASTLNQGVLLFNIIESILTSVHSFRRKAALRRQGTSREALGELDRRLSAWKQDLPEHLRLEPTDLARLDSSGPLPSLFVLLVWYYTAILLLHRPFIPQDDDATLQEVLENSSHQKCTLAANTLCDLLEPTSVDMDRLSGDLAFCIFSASLLFLFNCGLSDKVIAADARRRFGLCRQWLGKLSSRWPAASAHKQLLDGVATVGESYMSERKDQHDDAGHRAVHATSTKRPRSRASSKAQPPEKLSKTATSSASKKSTSTSEREKISSTLAASQGDAAALSSRKASSTSNERHAPAQTSTLPPTTSRVGANSHSTAQAYRDADVSNADASQGGAEVMLLGTNQQPIWGGFAASAEQQRAIIDYLHGTNAYDIPSTGAEFYSHAPSLFDADTVFWNETAGRRESVAGQQGVPQDGGPSMVTAATASELYRQRHEQPAADGLAMLANVTARDGMLHEPHHRQPFPTTHSFLLNSTSVQAPGHGIAQPQPQSDMALLGNLPQQQRGDFQDAQNWSAFQQLSTSSPFGFQLDPSQPTWSDVMSMLQLPPSFSSDPRSQPSPAPLPPPRTPRR